LLNNVPATKQTQATSLIIDKSIKYIYTAPYVAKKSKVHNDYGPQFSAGHRISSRICPFPQNFDIFMEFHRILHKLKND